MVNTTYTKYHSIIKSYDPEQIKRLENDLNIPHNHSLKVVIGINEIKLKELKRNISELENVMNNINKDLNSLNYIKMY